MKIVSLAIAACTALMLSSGAASTKDAPEADRAALIETVAVFEAAMAKDDYGTVVSMVPEKVFGALAEKYGVEPEKLAALVADQMETVLDDVKILEFDIETDDVAIEQTKSGVVYAFLPTRTLIEMEDTKVETKSSTLALRDGDAWRLLRVDSAAQLLILKDVYPAFTGIEFPKSSTKLIE